MGPCPSLLSQLTSATVQLAPTKCGQVPGSSGAQNSTGRGKEAWPSSPGAPRLAPCLEPQGPTCTSQGTVLAPGNILLNWLGRAEKETGIGWDLSRWRKGGEDKRGLRRSRGGEHLWGGEHHVVVGTSSFSHRFRCHPGFCDLDVTALSLKIPCSPYERLWSPSRRETWRHNCRSACGNLGTPHPIPCLSP